jgi:polyhydroxybutyrate depolymerase
MRPTSLRSFNTTVAMVTAGTTVAIALLLGACGQTRSTTANPPDDGPASGSAGATTPAGQGGGNAGTDGGGTGTSGSSVSTSNGGSSSAAGNDAGSPGTTDSTDEPVEGPEPSSGCELGNASPVTSLNHYDKTLVQLPNGYDGATPFPVLFGLHETGGRGQVAEKLPPEHVLSQHYIVVTPRVYLLTPHSFESERLETFPPLVDEVLATFCVDRRAIFGVGIGSGGRHLAQLSCGSRAISTTPRAASGNDHFRAVTTIGAFYDVCYSWPGFPVLFIHGADAAESRSLARDPDGAIALARLITNNGCEMSSVPVQAAACEGRSQAVNPGCVDFSGCSEPLRFCRHDDPEGATHNSGWPCFASDQMYEFFERQRP